MIQNEVTLMTDRWLKDATYGAAAMMAGVPNKTPEGVDRAAVVMPPIYNDVEHESLAGNQDLDLPTTRGLVVYCDAPVVMDQNASKSYSVAGQEMRVTVGWLTRDENAVKAVSDGGVLLRATMLSLFKWNDQKAAGTSRDLNGVKIAKVLAVRVYRTAGAVGKSRLWGFVQANLMVLDKLSG